MSRSRYERIVSVSGRSVIAATSAGGVPTLVRGAVAGSQSAPIHRDTAAAAAAQCTISGVCTACELQDEQQQQHEEEDGEDGEEELQAQPGRGVKRPASHPVDGSRQPKRGTPTPAPLCVAIEE